MAKRQGQEMFSMVDGKKTDAHLHAALLGDDEDFCYDLNDLPTDRPITDEDVRRARELYAERRGR